MTKSIFCLVHETARKNAVQCVLAAPDGYAVTVSEPTRNLMQNAKMWALLADIADQVVWHGHKYSPMDWKDLLTSSLRKQRAAPGIDEGFVVFGERTKTYTKAQMAEMIELTLCFGAQHGVTFGGEQ